ncbi:MAG: DUF1934 domain-containing protein [Oscillospiraceae bacterium]|nr:DUF1934 domain-containing protein [Oscillospiraceae bacterium]
MRKEVILTIRGTQYYEEGQPEVIELVTEGTLELVDGGWEIGYEESELTGLLGVHTTFRVEEEKITLTRTGKLRSQMIFQIGVLHESLYQMEFGALMITVCATKLVHDITENGGTVDLTYGIDIEQSAGGMVEYHLDIRGK